jgi:hypothetical protein
MAAALLALAYEHQLPLALECVTGEAVQKPLELHMRGQSLRQVITVISASVAACRVDFAQGLVDVYPAEARTDPSDLFNTVIPEYRAVGVDTDMADRMLLCALPPCSAGCGGSSAGDQWGHAKINLEMRNARVYQILNAIVAKNGRAVWVPVRPSRASFYRSLGYVTNFWNIYPLDPAFEQTVAGAVRGVLTPTARSDPHADAGYLHATPSDEIRPAPAADLNPQPRSCCGPSGPTPPKE